MVIAFPNCSWKCETEYGERICQNNSLATLPTFTIPIKEVVRQYLNNSIPQAMVFGGLEPFDSYDEMMKLIDEFRKHTDDDIVIYTGYKQNEIIEQIAEISTKYNNIIIKIGRYIPNDEPYYNEDLGLNLSSKNQYTIKINK